MSVEPKNLKLDRTPDSSELGALPPRQLTPEQEDKVKGGLVSSQELDIDGLQGN